MVAQLLKFVRTLIFQKFRMLGFQWSGQMRSNYGKIHHIHHHKPNLNHHTPIDLRVFHFHIHLEIDISLIHFWNIHRCTHKIKTLFVSTGGTKSHIFHHNSLSNCPNKSMSHSKLFDSLHRKIWIPLYKLSFLLLRSLMKQLKLSLQLWNPH